MDSKKARRIRMTTCPYCQCVTPVDRRQKLEGEDFHFGICHRCFVVYDIDTAETWLAERDDWSPV